MRSFLPSPATVQWGFFDARREPIGTVGSGETFHLRSVSGHPDDAVPADWRIPELHTIYAEVADRGPGPHLLTGPIAVDGARVGDTLQVDVVDVRIGARYGYTRIAPGAGLLGHLVEADETVIVPIVHDAGPTGVAVVAPCVSLPLRPFFGILGVAPAPALGRLDSRPPGAHGGNIDCTELIAGSTLFLPVAVDGARFSAGDGHAVQGDGEMCVTAVETTMEGTLRLSVRRDLAVDAPIAVTDDHLITFGFDPDLDQAAEVAGRALVDHLVARAGLRFGDAYRLGSCAADLRITQVVNGVKGVHAMLPRSVLRQLGADDAMGAGGTTR